MVLGRLWRSVVELVAVTRDNIEMSAQYFIGLPQWHHPEWHRSVLGDADTTTALQRYAASFSSVEGNTTFYGLPSAETVAKWRYQVPDHFRFCFKFPREISHGDGLLSIAAERALLEFWQRLGSLGDKLGQLWLQLPSSFGPDRLMELEQFLARLPAGCRYAVEVRHPAFFAPGEADTLLNTILASAGVNRACFDTRALFSHPSSDRITQEALQQKPRLPLRAVATASAPLVRIITPLSLELGDQVVDGWVKRVAHWLGEGREPYLFFHTPDNQASPELAARFAEKLARVTPATGFTRWPEPVEKQPGLFG